MLDSCCAGGVRTLAVGFGDKNVDASRPSITLSRNHFTLAPFCILVVKADGCGINLLWAVLIVSWQRRPEELGRLLNWEAVHHGLANPNKMPRPDWQPGEPLVVC